MRDLKIIKSVSSNEYAIAIDKRWRESRNIGDINPVEWQPFLEWGLSNTGELCCRGVFGYCSYPDWVEYESCCFSISMVEMKKIIKEFGHLLVFA